MFNDQDAAGGELAHDRVDPPGALPVPRFLAN